MANVIATDSFLVPKRSMAAQIVPPTLRRQLHRLQAMIAVPVFCLGLSLLGLLPMLLE